MAKSILLIRPKEKVTFPKKYFLKHWLNAKTKGVYTGIAPSTVKTRRQNICGELGLRGPNALMWWAIEKKRQLV
ncbi:hypothetical protein [Fodinibius roseus]|uniref:hypothetical protein n=1 Tax=Fodinibius roseus TaxID=1194090 RepID=UPI0011148E12|nr:hypothetical protein [Fodinibius roseus]